jgi:succinate dehydrogenase flavin-adding protein (antitoxin of CptAB toxin-antitoxin module)
MTKKQEIIELLKKEQDQTLAKFFLQKIDSMQEADLNDLYFLLTSQDKIKINAFAKNKSEELQKQSSELEQIGVQAKKITVKYKKKKSKDSDDTYAEDLLYNL